MYEYVLQYMFPFTRLELFLHCVLTDGQIWFYFMIKTDKQIHVYDLRLCDWFLRITSDYRWGMVYIDGLVHDCSISSALVMEILLPYTKP